MIDDADTSPDAAVLLASLASTPQIPAAPVRVLLTARTAEGLARLASQLPQQARWIIAPENLPIRPVGPFGTTDDHARWLGEAARAYAAARGTPPPDLPAAISTGNLARSGETMLMVQARALLAVLDTQRRRPGHPQTRTLPFGQVAQALFDHEQDRWQDAADQPGWGLGDLTGPEQQRAIAALMLSGAATEPEAITALRAVPDLADATAERLARIARWAFHLYPSGPVQIQPGMLAEWFLISQLTTTPGLAAHLEDLAAQRVLSVLALLAHASDHMPEAVPLFARLVEADLAGRAAAAADAALTARTGQPLLDAVLSALIASRWNLGTLADLDRHLPDGALPRTRAAVAAATVRQARQDGTPEDLGRALYSYGARLRNLGRYREALAAEEEALALWRDLAATNPAHQPDLANALNSTGVSLRDLGRDSDALARDREALDLYARLARSDPDLYRTNYHQLLGRLRTTYDLEGDLSTSISLHLRRDQ